LILRESREIQLRGGGISGTSSKLGHHLRKRTPLLLDANGTLKEEKSISEEHPANSDAGLGNNQFRIKKREKKPAAVNHKKTKSIRIPVIAHEGMIQRRKVGGSLEAIPRKKGGGADKRLNWENQLGNLGGSFRLSRSGDSGLTWQRRQWGENKEIGPHPGVFAGKETQSSTQH